MTRTAALSLLTVNALAALALGRMLPAFGAASAPPPAPPPVLRPGSLDPGFGTGGTVVTDFGGTDDMANAVAVQPDGQIVVAGQSDAASGKTYVALARYNADGSLDTAFGTSGKVLADFGGNAGANAVALQPDGRIVVAGSSSANGKTQFALARYNGNGSLDPGFGSGGKVLTDFGSGVARADAVAVQPDGQIVVLGDFVLARYNGNGSLDTSFGSGGKVLAEFGGGAVALQPDGQIVVVGTDFGLARYNGNGSLDTSFGTGGRALADFAASAVAVQPDGRIIVAGSQAHRGFDSEFAELALGRYTGNGSLDTSFGTGGKVLTNFGSDGAGAVAVQRDGQIVAAGQGFDDNSGNSGFVLGRYTGNGSLDTSFGTGGRVLTGIGDGAGANALAVQPDGRIVAAGYASANGKTQFALARYQGR